MDHRNPKKTATTRKGARDETSRGPSRGVAFSSREFELGLASGSARKIRRAFPDSKSKTIQEEETMTPKPVATQQPASRSLTKRPVGPFSIQFSRCGTLPICAARSTRPTGPNENGSTMHRRACLLPARDDAEETSPIGEPITTGARARRTGKLYRTCHRDR